MDIKIFIKVMRKLINEEVRKAVRSELKQVLQEQKVPYQKTINNGVALHRKVDAPKKSYTKNSMLNDILNETANTMQPGDLSQGKKLVEYAEPPTMAGRALTSNDVPSFAEIMGTTSEPNAMPSEDLEGNPVHQEQLPEELTTAFTRDYSGLMKAIDKKKGNR
jgi:hypothetical protein